LGDDIVVSDIGGWRKPTMPELPETAWFSIPPDWDCEVVSPSTAKYDSGIKREIYAREDVGDYWVVDPIAKTIEVLALENGDWVVTDVVADERVVSLAPFESLPFDLSVLWV